MDSLSCFSLRARAALPAAMLGNALGRTRTHSPARSMSSLLRNIPLVVSLIFLGLLSNVSIDLVQAQLKFAALGNWAYDAAGQKTVAETLKKTAAAERISFLASPGSNFPGGISAMNDTNWQTSFEDVYTDPQGTLKVPFFSVLGAEDWAGNYTAQVLMTETVYADRKEEQNYPKWTIPNWWHHHLMHFPANTGAAFINAGHKDMSVGMIFVDTWILSSSFPFSNVTSRAWADLQKTLEIAPKVLDYIVVVGDRPIYSSGASKGDSSLQYYLLPLLKKAGVDAYISGYDFDMEVIQDDELLHVNCGSGSMGGGSAMIHESNSKFFSGDIGFCLFELTADGIKVNIIDGSSGSSLFSIDQKVKKRSERKSINAFAYVSELPPVKYWPIPSMGKMPGRDVFVRVVGTIGLCIATVFLAIGVATAASKMMK